MSNCWEAEVIQTTGKRWKSVLVPIVLAWGLFSLIACGAGDEAPHSGLTSDELLSGQALGDESSGSGGGLVAGDEGVGLPVPNQAGDGAIDPLLDPAILAASEVGDGTRAPSFPVVVRASDGDVIVDSERQRIVSLSPTATEILFAIGAGDRVVAADRGSTFPAAAPAKSELSARNPDPAAVAAYQPDLVILETSSSGVAGLEHDGVVVITFEPAIHVEETVHQVRQLGLATGQLAGAAEQVDHIQSMLASMTEAVAAADAVRIYHEVDATFLSPSSRSFFGELYTRLGMENIADQVEQGENRYVTLNSDLIRNADPTVIVVANARSSADSVRGRPGWDAISAVTRGRVIEVDFAATTTWGPRALAVVDQVVQAATS